LAGLGLTQQRTSRGDRSGISFAKRAKLNGLVDSDGSAETIVGTLL
jgi:hypothetical protein